jgi:ubiquitin C-terminal hydrolase
MNATNGKWYYFNDGSVSAIEDSKMIQSAAAYMLFYRRRD